MLQLRGAGNSDVQGLTVDNIVLVKDGSSQNLVVNGGFENTKVKKAWNGFSENVPGWIAKYIEIGVGKFFNSRWPSQVCVLDAFHKTFINQIIRIENPRKYPICLSATSGGVLPPSQTTPTVPSPGSIPIVPARVSTSNNNL